MEKYANLFLFSLVAIAVLAAVIVSLRIRSRRSKLSEELSKVENIFDPLDEHDDDMHLSNHHIHHGGRHATSSHKQSGAMSDLGFDEIGSMFSEQAGNNDYLDIQDEYIKSNENEDINDPYKNIIVFNIMARPTQSFMGYDLLQALLAAGLRFGDMSIFHRYQEPQQGGKIIFSLASATEPGVFDMNKMGLYTCRGLTLFMQFREEYQDENAFDLMLMTAQQLSEDLDGILTDEQHQELTEEKVLALKNKINRFQKQF